MNTCHLTKIIAVYQISSALVLSVLEKKRVIDDPLRANMHHYQTS